MKRVDFKVLPTILDYMFMLESAPSMPTNKFGDTEQGVGEFGPRGRDYWYVKITPEILRRSGLKSIFTKTDLAYIKKGILVKTPFKRLSTGLSSFNTGEQDYTGNSILFLFLLLYLYQYRLPTDGNYFLQEYLRLYSKLSPYCFISNTGKFTMSHPAYDFVKKIFKISPDDSGFVDIPTNRLAFINGSMFCIFPPSEHSATLSERLAVVDSSGNILKQISVRWYSEDKKIILQHIKLFFGIFPSTNFMPTIENLALNSNLKNLEEGSSDGNAKVPNPKLFAFSNYAQCLMTTSDIKNNIIPFFYIVGNLKKDDLSTSVSPYFFRLGSDPNESINLNLHYPIDGNDFPYNTSKSFTPWQILFTMDVGCKSSSPSFYTSPYGFITRTTDTPIHYGPSPFRSGPLFDDPYCGASILYPYTRYFLSDKTNPAETWRTEDETSFNEFMQAYAKRAKEIMETYEIKNDSFVGGGSGVTPWIVFDTDIAKNVSLAEVLFNKSKLGLVSDTAQFPAQVPDHPQYASIFQGVRDSFFTQSLIDCPNEVLIDKILSAEKPNTEMIGSFSFQSGLTFSRSNPTPTVFKPTDVLSKTQTTSGMPQSIRISHFSKVFYNYFLQAHKIFE
jgi:hypothetical protein